MKVEKSLEEYDDFNSHARVGRDRVEKSIFHVFYDFNSHARVGRDCNDESVRMLLEISTHTPV